MADATMASPAIHVHEPPLDLAMTRHPQRDFALELASPASAPASAAFAFAFALDPAPPIIPSSGTPVGTNDASVTFPRGA
jgi:hypothetical protein